MYIALREEMREYSKELSFYISVTDVTLSKVQCYIDELETRGIKYYLSVKSKENLDNVVYVRLCEQNIRKAGKAILILDDETLQDKEAYNFAMYEAGLVMSEEKILFVVNNMSKEIIDSIFINSPIKNTQLSNFEEVLKEVDKCLMLPKNLFNNHEIDLYASKRIFYVKFLTMLDIRYSGFRRIYERLKNMDEDKEFQDVFDTLEESISVGVRLMHFGKVQHLSRPDYWPYYEEMGDLFLDFPVKSIVNKIKIVKKEFEEENEDSDVIATIKMEFVVPNNEILGATFKPYFQIESKKIKSQELVQLLLDDDITKESICVNKDSQKTRIYFALNVDDKKLEGELKPDLVDKYGQISNYVYAK